MDNYELYHHGIKGQKWGVRRYQNKDGSLTPLGRKTYGSRNNYERVKAKNAEASQQRVKQVKNVKNTIDSVDNALSKVDSVNRNVNALYKASKKHELANMTDEELIAGIESMAKAYEQKQKRSNLEDQYLAMKMSESRINNGKKYLSDVLDNTGTVLAIGSSALGIALAIKELRG